MQRAFIVIFLYAFTLFGCKENKETTAVEKRSGDYNDLVSLFKDWRSFEIPPLLNGAPDYTESTFAKRLPKFKELEQRLTSIDTVNWTLPHKVDWLIVQAEMNGYDFNQRILMPWSRDPAFYTTLKTERSDVPAHEGPTHHKTIELWQYSFPLSTELKNKLITELNLSLIHI